MVADGLLAVGAGILLATDSDYGETNVRSSSGERGAQANEAIMKLAKPMICGVDCRAKDTFNQTNQVKMKHIMWRGDGGAAFPCSTGVCTLTSRPSFSGLALTPPAGPPFLSRRSCINERTIDSMQG